LNDAAIDMLLPLIAKQVRNTSKMTPLAKKNELGFKVPNTRIWFNDAVDKYRFPGTPSISDGDLKLACSAAVLYETLSSISKASKDPKSKGTWIPWRVYLLAN
jgi:hypothetical protein